MTRETEQKLVPVESWNLIVGALKASKARLGPGATVCMVADALRTAEGVPPAPSGWKTMETAPRDGTPFYARHQSPFRFQPYKANSEQARRGIKGRWQTMNEYGGWDNCPEPVGDWTDHPDFPAADHIGDVTEMVRAAPSPDTGKMGGEGDQRAAFEAWYCADAAKHGLTFMPAEICSMRDGDGYGPERVAINSKWEGWQACAALSAPVSGGEGEAVAWVLRDPHMGMVFFTDQVSADNFLNPEKAPIEPLYTHPSAPAATERMRAAAQRMADDYQSSVAHHPEHVLVRKGDFEALVAALGEA